MAGVLETLRPHLPWAEEGQPSLQGCAAWLVFKSLVAMSAQPAPSRQPALGGEAIRAELFDELVAALARLPDSALAAGAEGDVGRADAEAGTAAHRSVSLPRLFGVSEAKLGVASAPGAAAAQGAASWGSTPTPADVAAELRRRLEAGEDFGGFERTDWALWADQLEEMITEAFYEVVSETGCGCQGPWRMSVEDIRRAQLAGRPLIADSEGQPGIVSFDLDHDGYIDVFELWGWMNATVWSQSWAMEEGAEVEWPARMPPGLPATSGRLLRPVGGEGRGPRPFAEVATEVLVPPGELRTPLCSVLLALEGLLRSQEGADGRGCRREVAELLLDVATRPGGPLSAVLALQVLARWTLADAGSADVDGFHALAAGRLLDCAEAEASLWDLRAQRRELLRAWLRRGGPAGEATQEVLAAALSPASALGLARAALFTVREPPALRVLASHFRLAEDGEPCRVVGLEAGRATDGDFEDPLGRLHFQYEERWLGWQSCDEETQRALRRAEAAGLTNIQVTVRDRTYGYDLTCMLQVVYGENGETCRSFRRWRDPRDVARAPRSVRCPRDHELLYNEFRPVGWKCDASREAGGCRRNCTDFNQSAMWLNWRCEECDYDLCDLCYEDRLQRLLPEAGGSGAAATVLRESMGTAERVSVFSLRPHQAGSDVVQHLGPEARRAAVDAALRLPPAEAWPLAALLAAPDAAAYFVERRGLVPWAARALEPECEKVRRLSPADRSSLSAVLRLKHPRLYEEAARGVEEEPSGAGPTEPPGEAQASATVRDRGAGIVARAAHTLGFDPLGHEGSDGLKSWEMPRLLACARQVLASSPPLQVPRLHTLGAEEAAKSSAAKPAADEDLGGMVDAEPSSQPSGDGAFSRALQALYVQAAGDPELLRALVRGAVLWDRRTLALEVCLAAAQHVGGFSLPPGTRWRLDLDLAPPGQLAELCLAFDSVSDGDAARTQARAAMLALAAKHRPMLMAVRELALAHLVGSLGVAGELEVARYESGHPYAKNEHVEQEVCCPGASRLVVRFAPECRSEHGMDTLRIVAGGVTHARTGSQPWQDIVVEQDSFKWVWQTDGSCRDRWSTDPPVHPPSRTDWGYSFVVFAEGSGGPGEGSPRLESGLRLLEFLLDHLPRGGAAEPAVLLRPEFAALVLAHIERHFDGRLADLLQRFIDGCCESGVVLDWAQARQML